MSKGWHTKADVLKDLGEVNGRRTGAEHLDQHVVAGERPPPILLEAPDADEMSYFFGGIGPSVARAAGPDLDGISVMLKMVNDLDDSVDNHEPMTLYCNKVTDEIRISKLNPCAGEYVPGAGSKFNNRNDPNQNSPKTSNRIKCNSDRTLIKHVEIPVNESKETPVLEKKRLDVLENSHKKPVSQNEPVNSDIKEIEEKIRSTLIASTKINSLQIKRQKNVAIATLLKMGMTSQPPVKLMRPEDFQNPPSKEEEQMVKNKTANEEVPSMSGSETDGNHIDQDSLLKVDGWFKNMECPKPKQLPLGPLPLKDDASSIIFKKKTNSSVTSRNSNSEASQDNKQEPLIPREIKAFKPSSYASDLLKKYEDNAQRATPHIEDLGTRLERQLRERDLVIRQKLSARQNAG